MIMAGNVTELTDATFDETINGSDMPVLVDFWAPWCGPCKMIAPIVEEIAEEYSDKAKICKLNTDDARDSAMEFGISAIPTLILFKNGQIEKKWVGLTSKKDISSAIDELL
jgi:thioredoxin 1